MIFAQIRMGAGMNFTYVFGDEKSGEAAVVDPGCDVEKILEAIKQLQVHIRYIFNTHSHVDHTAGNSKIKRITKAKVVMHALAPLPKDVAVKDQDCICVGDLIVKVIHTPGHTPDGICLLVDKKLFTGDTLFVGECGRTDLPGGNAEDMYRSLFEKILSLSDDVEVYPGHDYGKRPYSTIGHERKTNYTLEKRSLEEFLQFMQEQ
ncbi:MAG: MBL fold metallo-hydrolase [Candidatus Bathyarchaeia archaeon]